MSDHFDWWRRALADPAKIGSKELPVHENEPQCGYYRKRNDDGLDEPVAIYIDQAGEMVAQIMSRRVDPYQIWTWVSRSPVSYEVFRNAFEGKGWPDSLPSETAGMGHNRPDEAADPFEALKFDLEAEQEQAEAFLKEPVTTQDAADRAAAWAKKLGEIAKKADNHRKVEKQPHIDAGNAVDQKWNPVRDLAKDLSTRLKRSLDDWLRKQREAEEARRRKAEAEAAEARRKAEEAAKAAETEAARSSEDAEKAEAEARAAAEAAEAAAKEAAARPVNAGRTGAKVAYKTFKTGEITDQDAFYQAVKDRDDVREFFQTLANRAARGGHELPGMKIKEDRKAA